MAKPYLKKCNHFMVLSNHEIGNEGITLNGHIVAEFEDNKVEKQLYKCGSPFPYENKKGTCLTDDELEDYAFQYNIGHAPALYYLHINNLKAFDKLLELSDVEVSNKNANPYLDDPFKPLTKAPQNMCYVWHNGELKVLISIRSPYVCNIMEGIKTIEVRKKVLKGCL